MRYLLLLAALALLSLVVRDYLGSRPAERLSTRALPVLPEDRLAQSENWRWVQTTGESTRIEVSADDFVQGSDGLTVDLRGVVMKIFRLETGDLDRVESAAMRMLADGSLYSDGETLITLGVPADGGRRGRMRVVASEVTFRPADNSASTDRRVEYRFADGAGSSLGAAYDATNGVLRMVSEVRLERYGTHGRPPTTLQAGSLRYAEEGVRIDLAGRARIEQGAGWLECDKAVVSLADGLVRRVDGVAARGGESLPGRRTAFAAQRLEAEFRADGELERLRGSGGAEFASAGQGQRFEVRADSLDLRYEPQPGTAPSLLRRVAARGAARGSMHASADGATSTIESEALDLLLRRGAMRIERLETVGSGTLRQLARRGEVAARTLSAGGIRMTYGAAGNLEALAAEGGTQLLQSPADEQAPDLRTWSETLHARLDPATSEIAELRQAGNFRFEEGARRGRADRARFELQGGLLELSGTAHVASAAGRLAARTIVLERAGGKVEAGGDVTGFWLQDPSQARQASPAGMFGGRQPVFVAAGRAVSDPQRGTLECRDGARLWQGGNRVDADLIIIDQAASRIAARGRVEAAWADRGGAASLSVARSERMRYEARTGVARFQGAVDFRRQGMRVLADALQTVPRAGKDAGLRAVASGSVRIAVPPDGSGHRARGERAEFDTLASEVVLTGRPARIRMRDGAESEGASLTYRTAGDSLLVLGRHAERAYTYRPIAR